MNFFLESDASQIVAKSTTISLKPFIFNPFLALQPNIRGNLRADNTERVTFYQKGTKSIKTNCLLDLATWRFQHEFQSSKLSAAPKRATRQCLRLSRVSLKPFRLPSNSRTWANETVHCPWNSKLTFKIGSQGFSRWLYTKLYIKESKQRKRREAG